MRQPWTKERIRAAVVGEERQIEHVITASLAQDPHGKTIADASYGVVHAAVVSLVTLFRDHVSDAAASASIAREYAKCVAGTVRTPSVACIRHVLGVVQTARELHLPA